MKTQNKYVLLPLIFCLQFFLSCSSDDADEVDLMPEPDPVYTVNDLDATIEENPEDGTILGTLTTDLPGSLTFTSSNPALGFDIASLEVTVADKAAFDYELNTNLTGTITITNGEDSVTSSITITLTDFVDAIEAHLTISKDAYASASSGEWIEVTKDEFEALENQLEEISHSGISQEDYDFDINTAVGFSGGNNDTRGRTVAHVSDATLPIGSYLFGIRFYAGTGIFEVSEGNKIKLSETSITGEYFDIGNPLPEKTSTEREVFFILKGNLTATTNSAHLAFYYAPKNGGGRKVSNGFRYESSRDATDFAGDPRQGHTYAYQGLSTTKLQWE
ncbi:cadherin repeat domain-containing protein [Maribacter algarum]|uniref:Cadherin repeat domain-containing protein n=1 Tax=Maribacter algarum (ex Zhang et al. 2020) TaxID=2578118 RepID=A0A5S3PNA9_9FLAO|nr:cadherin repeat domain-containing protein [Maribacter algarum]TMM55962.1 cadherin repeat domain-containing protein [Maribacter algarum]